MLRLRPKNSIRRRTGEMADGPGSFIVVSPNQRRTPRRRRRTFARTNRTDRETWVRAGRYSVSYPEDTHAQNRSIRRFPRPTQSTGFRADPCSGRGGRGARFFVLRLTFRGVARRGGERRRPCWIGRASFAGEKREIFPDSRLFSLPPGGVRRRSGRPRYTGKYLNIKGLTWTLRRPIEAFSGIWIGSCLTIDIGLCAPRHEGLGDGGGVAGAYHEVNAVGFPVPAGSRMCTPATSSADSPRLFTPLTSSILGRRDVRKDDFEG